MHHPRPLTEVVRDLAPVVEALPASARSEMMGSIVGLSYDYLQEDDARAILAALKMANVLEKLVEEGIAKGRTEGRTEGRVEGRAEALRALVSLKFGSVPSALEERIARADLSELERLFARAVAAERLEAI
ncbi:MAG TPA: hypothetical protein VNL35_04500 [Chloroflexota bacterium]|nr:hypothetical protein [Chloroflexota bacterium]